ncbi:MAG: host attachment protein [Caulobacter sp.]|nr:host attachment protein [Caulobacter sp.]
MIPDGRTLVVVADGARARLFEEKRRGGPLTEHPNWLAGVELKQRGHGPAPGRVFDSHGYASHGVGGETPHDKSEREFIVDLVKRVETVVREHDFDDLVVIAAPRALGNLREALPTGLQKKLRETAPKDRLDETDKEIHQALQDMRRESA